MTLPKSLQGAAAVLVASIAFLYAVHFRGATVFWQMSPQEGGSWVDQAWRVLHGELIYRDFFEFLTPGVVYVDAFFLWLLGPTPQAVGVMLIVIGTLAALGVYAVSAAILPNYWRFVPVAIFVGLTYPSYSPGNHKWPTLILCLVGIVAVLEASSRLRCALSGAAYGGAILCTIDLGAGGALGMLSALWLLRTHAMTFAVACAATVVLTMAGFAIVAGPAAVWHNGIGFVFEQYGTSECCVSVFTLNNLPYWLTTLGLGGLGLAFTAIGVVQRFWRDAAQPLVVTSLVGAGLALIGGAMHPIEPIQLGPKMVPLTIIGTYVLQRMVARRIARPWPLLPLIVLGACLASVAIYRPIRVQKTQPLLLEEHRAGRIWTPGPPSYFVALAWLEANTVEGERVLLLPDLGGFNLLSRTRRAITYTYLQDGGFHSAAQISDAMRQIARECPAVGIWHRSRFWSYGNPRPELQTMKPLERALFHDYEIAAEFWNGAVALRRKAKGCASLNQRVPPTEGP